MSSIAPCYLNAATHCGIPNGIMIFMIMLISYYKLVRYAYYKLAISLPLELCVCVTSTLASSNQRQFKALEAA